MRKSLTVGVVLAVLCCAGAAQAADWPVAAGEQSRPPAGTYKFTTLDQFMPSRVVIHAGDTVTFSSASFHTATYTGGQKAPPVFARDPANAKYAGLNDAAGQPFFFAGVRKLIYNPRAFAPAGGNTVPGDGLVSSGALSPGGPKQKVATFTAKFPKAGSYQFICTIHPGMKATVVVKPAGAPLAQTPTQVRAAILKEQTAAFAKSNAEAKAAKPPANTVYQGVGSGVTLLGYFPKTIKVKVGTTVSFVNKSPPEVHNIVFGPPKYVESMQKKTDLFPMGPTGPNQVSPLIAVGSEPKGEFDYAGASTHGNGFLSTPLTGGSPKLGLPKVNKVTFTKAGTYKYFCWIHGKDMAGTVVVTP